MVAVSVRASFMAFLVVLGLTGIVWHPLTHGDAHLSGLGLGQEALNDRFHDLGGMHMQVPDVEEVDLHHVQNAWDVIPQEQIAAQRQASLAESSEEDDSMQVCSNITVYGMMISEAHGMPYHYQNRCPQPYGERDEAEWLLFKRFAQNGLLQFREPCVVECHESGEMCESCRALHPEVFSKDAMAAGHAIWNRMPMPEYCVSRAKVLAAERLAKAQGKVGERGFTKEQRDALMNKFSSKPQVSAAAKAARAASSRSSHASSSSLGASASSSSRRYHVGRISRRR